jgi:hypothetical protein
MRPSLMPARLLLRISTAAGEHAIADADRRLTGLLRSALFNLSI